MPHRELRCHPRDVTPVSSWVTLWQEETTGGEGFASSSDGSPAGLGKLARHPSATIQTLPGHGPRGLERWGGTFHR